MLGAASPHRGSVIKEKCLVATDLGSMKSVICVGPDNPTSPIIAKLIHWNWCSGSFLELPGKYFRAPGSCLSLWHLLVKCYFRESCWCGSSRFMRAFWPWLFILPNVEEVLIYKYPWGRRKGAYRSFVQFTLYIWFFFLLTHDGVLFSALFKLDVAVWFALAKETWMLLLGWRFKNLSWMTIVCSPYLSHCEEFWRWNFSSAWVPEVITERKPPAQNYVAITPKWAFSGRKK